MPPPVFTAARLAERFRGRHGTTPRLFRAPGRINLIGEHTDYTGGLAMPGAIDRACYVAAAPNGGQTLSVTAVNLGAEAQIPLGEMARTGGWRDYVAGIAFELAAAGVPLAGADLMIESDVPIGAGVSSSAALEVAAALALAGLAGRALGGLDLARLAQRAENKFAGVPCGIMDQFAAVHGAAGRVLLLDCATLGFDALPLPAGLGLIVIDSRIARGLVDGAYAERRAACERAAAALGKALRDTNLDELADAPLDETARQRARHIIGENTRVTEAAAVLRSGTNDGAGLGRLLLASHASLRDDLEISTPEIDALVEAAAETSGVLGARIMGGGFGGSVIALVDETRSEEAAAAILDGYRRRTGIAAAAHPVRLSAGAGEITP